MYIVSFGLFSIDSPSTHRLGIAVPKIVRDGAIDGPIETTKAMGIGNRCGAPLPWQGF